MSSTAWHIVELVKSLPPEEQQTICTELAKVATNPESPKRRQLQRLPDGTYYNPNGIPNDDPVFRILEQIEEERHRSPDPRGRETDHPLR
jgi:hypothetical protein